MEIGSEISHKIRSAIKAKLVELRAYVDEELPDYIMVMVANKKSKLQMTEDLNLFLGANTDKFTAWLHTLISKLQSISIDGKEVELESNDAEKTDKQKPERKKHGSASSTGEQLLKKSEKSAPAMTAATTTAQNKEAKLPKSQQPTVKLPTDQTPTGQQPTGQQPTGQQPPVQKPPVQKPSEELEEVEFIVRADTDEFSEELKAFESQQQTETMKKPTAASEVKPSITITPPVSAVTPGSVPTATILPAAGNKQLVRPTESALSRLKERKTVIRTEARHDGRSVVAADAGPTVIRRAAVSRSSMLSSSALKRKVPISIVKSISRPEEEDEEEYDPHNPSVGSVASVVKVTARKSSVPRSLQANKNLLMKAMTDAERSITIVNKRSVADARQGTSPSRSLYSDIQGTVIVDNIRSRLYNPRNPRMISRPSKDDIMKKMKYTIANESRQDSTEGSEEDLEPDNRVVQVDPEEEEAEEEEEASSPEESIIAVSDQRIAKPREEEVEQEVEEVIPVILEEEEASYEFLEQDPTETEMSSAKAQARVEPRRQPLVQHQEEEEEANLEYSNSRLVKENSKNTRFIVTLDGVDPEKYESMDLDLEDNDKTGKLLEVTPQITTPKIKPFSINLKDSDDEDDEVMTPLKKAKMTEKCRFWPACVNGNTCEYHHPTVPCKTFPSCKYRDKCLYIHPNCKYDSRCTKTDCPFTHASKRKPITTSPPQVITVPQPKVILATSTGPPQSHSRQITCRFYPNCHNMKCPFKHPKPCRYGVGCAKKTSGCPFFHPILPTKDKLTWKSDKMGPGSSSNSDGIKAS